MTNEVTIKIYEMKKQGLGYKRIASELGLPLSTVKSAILRHKNANKTICLYCGQKLVNKPKTKKKKFCFASCKRKYLNRHPEAIKPSKSETKVCPSCGKIFVCYKSSNGAYCSHSCSNEDILLIALMIFFTCLLLSIIFDNVRLKYSTISFLYLSTRCKTNLW